ncbi:MAG: fumarylacetoacetate hydrolase family protein [Bacteroidales bacterium]|nr:fumarylacetoacetate hydrolase family protein [Bacteroidales bacterium]MCF8334407.1 fumarylacetoacetate hydrolase family protein [Bacteroidales bacterium]
MKIICIGRNYVLHAKEFGNEVPFSPVFFLKPDTALLTKNRPFYYPDISKEIQYEAEVVVKINKVGKHIQEKFANTYYEEISLGVDFTARDLQREAKSKGLPWEKAKAFDQSAVLGDWIPKKDFEDIKNINFRLEKNGDVVQNGNTGNMTFTIDYLISYLSKFFTLKMGDLIYTGTPAGVADVKINDRMTGYIEDKKMFDFKIK